MRRCASGIVSMMARVAQVQAVPRRCHGALNYGTERLISMEPQQYQRFSPPALALAMGVAALIGTLFVGLPMMGFGGIMGGNNGGYGWMMGGYGAIGFGVAWIASALIAALVGAVIAWVYNLVIAAQWNEAGESTRERSSPAPGPR